MKKERFIYKYQVIGKDGKLEDYSGPFYTKTEAKKWHDIHGVWLMEKFNHKSLYLIENKLK